MPMPHRTFVQVAKRRLVGKVGSGQRGPALRGSIEELPDYRNGPFADISKWVTEQIADMRVRAKVVHRDSIACAARAWRRSRSSAHRTRASRRCCRRCRTSRSRRATTRSRRRARSLRSRPSAVSASSSSRSQACSRRVRGSRRPGRAMPGVLRNADAIVYRHAASAPPEGSGQLRHEVEGLDRAARSARGDQGGRGRRARSTVSRTRSATSSSWPCPFSTISASKGFARRSGAVSG